MVELEPRVSDLYVFTRVKAANNGGQRCVVIQSRSATPTRARPDPCRFLHNSAVPADVNDPRRRFIEVAVGQRQFNQVGPFKILRTKSVALIAQRVPIETAADLDDKTVVRASMLQSLADPDRLSAVH